MRILLVEDNRDILANLADYLDMKGYSVDCAQDGLSGLHLAATEHYDLIVLDVGLTGVDGLALAREIRSRSAIPIIMLTGRAENVQKVVGLEVNANHIRSVRSGRVRGVCRALHVGSRHQVWQIEISDEQGRLCCSSRLTTAVI